MCEPTTIALAALQAAKSVSAINNQNQASAANRENANAAKNDEMVSSTEAYVEQNRSLIQGGFDAVLEGRANEATAYASAIENGVQGNSVKGMLRDKKVLTSRNKGRAKSEIKSLGTQQGANLRHIGSKAKGRIASVPTTSFGLGDAANILSPIVRAEME